MKIKIALLACLNLVFGLNVAHAGDDFFWYAYPMPQAYLYVQDPLRYRMWEASYGYYPVHMPARSPAYRPVVRTHDRSRFRRRECEIRILAGG